MIVNIDQLCVSIVQTLHGLHSANTININMVQIWPCKDSQLWICPKMRLGYFFTNIQELQDSLKIPNDLLINLDSIYQIIFVYMTLLSELKHHWHDTWVNAKKMTIEWRQLSNGLRMRTFLWTYNTTLKIVNIVRGIQEIVYENSTLKLSQHI